MSEKIKLIAHGGYSAKFEENTIKAYTEATKYNPHAIEMDVVVDPESGSLVCFHPQGLSSPKGIYVQETVQDQLANQQKLFLSEILQTIPAVIFLLDFKQPSESAFRALQEFSEEERHRFIVGVRDMDYFRMLVNIFPETDTLALFKDPDDYHDYANSGGRIFRLWQKDVSTERIEQLHQAWLEVWVTPGHKATETQPRTAGQIDEANFNQLLDLGVDAILVNDIKATQEYLHNR